jgi:hypothetical protein
LRRQKRKWVDSSERQYIYREKIHFGYEGSQTMPARLSGKGRLKKKARRSEVEGWEVK